MLTDDVKNPKFRAPGPMSDSEIATSIADKLEAYAADPAHPDLAGHPDGNPIMVRPAFPAAADWTARLIQGVNNNQQRYIDGVKSPRASFKARALANAGAYDAGVQKAIANKSYVKGMQNVDEDMAIQMAATVGAASYASGVTARKDKIQKKAEKLVPLAAAAISTVRNMPAITEADRDNRMLAMAKAMRQVGLALKQ